MNSAFELIILETGNGSHVAIGKTSSSMAVETLQITRNLADLLSYKEILSAALEASGERPSQDSLDAFGHELFKLAITGSIENLFNRFNGNVDLSIQIASTDSLVKSLPWEYLHDPNLTPPPLRTRSVVRIVPTIGIEHVAPAARRAASKLKVLVVWSQPSDQGPIGWPSIQASLNRTLGNKQRVPEEVEMKTVNSATIADLTRILNRENFDVLHFCCHGGITENGTGFVVLSDLAGNSVRMSATDLSILLSGINPRLVFLGACKTAAGSFSSNSVVAETLIKAGVQAVIANQFAVPASTMAIFTGSIYQELVLSGDIDLAVAKARVALSLERDVLVKQAQANLEWGIPTLYRHASCMRIL